jgi:hypothetical protein
VKFKILRAWSRPWLVRLSNRQALKLVVVLAIIEFFLDSFAHHNPPVSRVNRNVAFIEQTMQITSQEQPV